MDLLFVCVSVFVCRGAFQLAVAAENPVFDLGFFQPQRIGDFLPRLAGFAHGEDFVLVSF